MPAEGLPWLKRDALLTYEEIARLVRVLSRDGRPRRAPDRRRAARAQELWRLVEALSAIDGVHDLSLTTNGYLLEAQVADLVAAGLRRVNVSLDALAADRFFQLTRRDALDRVLAGLRGRPGASRAAADQGQRGRAARASPRTRCCASPRFAREEPYEIRFIEFMPLDADQEWDMEKVLPNAEIKAIIETEYELVPLGRERHGTARRYRFADGKGEIGFISPSPSRSAATATASG